MKLSVNKKCWIKRWRNYSKFFMCDKQIQLRFQYSDLTKTENN